jgi:hypothetical protein
MSRHERPLDYYEPRWGIVAVAGVAIMFWALTQVRRAVKRQGCVSLIPWLDGAALALTALLLVLIVLKWVCTYRNRARSARLEKAAERGRQT